MEKALAKDVKRLFRGIEDHTIAEVLDTGATLTDLESAALWLAGEEDAGGKLRAQSGGAAARVYDLIFRELDDDDEDA